MQTITAFKCQHCGKVYEKNQSCKNHESKCYFNPKTFSCASCAFKIFGEYKMPNGHFTNVRTCMLNFDITSRLKTKCSHHISSSHPEVRKNIQQNKKSYFPDLVVKKHLDRLMKIPRFPNTNESEKDRKEQIMECFFNLGMNHLLVTILQKMRLKSTIKFNDRDLESYFEFYMNWLKQAETMFYHFGFEDSRVNSLISKVSEVWKLDETEFSKTEINSLFALLDNGVQINELLLPKEKGTLANRIFNSLNIQGLRCLIANQQFICDDPPGQYYLNFESAVKSVDPKFIADLERLITEIMIPK